MLDWTYMMFFTLFATVFAMSVGLFEFSAAEGADDEDDGPEFEPDQYTDIVMGTPEDDAMSAQTYEADLAYMLAEGSDTLVATSGDDYADGGAGNDLLILSHGADIGLGGAGDDTLRGGEGDDMLYGQHGDDEIYGDGGDDTLFGGSGDDVLDGGAGDDVLEGGSGDDRLDGGEGDDWLDGGAGADVLDGGDGDDVLILGAGDLATGGEGADEFHVYDIDSPDASPAEVTDFEPRTDAIHVLYVANTDPDTGEVEVPEIGVSFDDEADETVVTLNGHAVATLAGDAGITADDVVLTPIH
ncbi:calcium-binding protein [Maritimibacter fusiformis]|uniref:Calcium-binding protein n=1 Tax=Maritimibacter fusiformis TaxID=2603819 RepID=A0A5D0RJI7_9RHOB|nr:calcium-binding protein [Maritimibacter fusiformis]TYB81797.1 calcium-binding protein [Maritimibacter fusiformis]